jgi:trk system potassium uptake protein TrkH|tara:strand:- start:1196 stop:2680 length:1485 start_codon:yes stop_codon:yes gene_type:complete
MKINHKIILYFIGFLLLFNGGFMFVSSIVSYYYKDGITMDMIYSGIIVSLIGGLLLFLNRNHDKQLNKREGYLVVVLGWLAMIFTGTLPYLLTGTIDGFSNIIFETTSGFTTTGATILNDVEAMPEGILFWRSITHWLGGMGIIVFAIAILPLLGIGGMQIFSAESPGMNTDKLHPRITDTAKRLWLIYLLFTLVETLLLTFAGMSVFDAINHSMSNIASGGFSTKNESLGFWNDQPLIQYIVIFFMFIAGTNFVLSYFGFKGKFRKIIKNDEFKIYSLFIAAFTLIVTSVIYLNTNFLSELTGGFTRIEEVFRHALFQVVSIITTTGFTTTDYTAWGPLLLLIFFGLMFVGGSTGSTAGGFKVMRHLLIIKNGLLQFKRILHPHAILPIRYNQKSVSSEIMYNILGFFIVYMLSFIAGALVFSILGLDFESSLGVSASSLGNVGPSIGDFGPSSNFYNLPLLAKWWSSFLMLLGRLELYTVLIIITPYFWRNT